MKISNFMEGHSVLTFDELYDKYWDYQCMIFPEDSTDGGWYAELKEKQLSDIQSGKVKDLRIKKQDGVLYVEKLTGEDDE